MTAIQDNIIRIQEQITTVCHKLRRDPQEITLIAVTKFAPVEKIEEALAAGLTHVAENKVQEGEKKYPLLKKTRPNLTSHMIGHLQTNKVKDALAVFDIIQSIDSLKLLQEVEKQAAKLNHVADVLIQVNTAREEQKYGLAPEEALPLLEKGPEFSHVRILGLMAIAPFTQDEKVIRGCFRGLREIRDAAQNNFKGASNIAMKYLSMGMTEDFPIALEEGANMLRVGRAIFQEGTQ